MVFIANIKGCGCALHIGHYKTTTSHEHMPTEHFEDEKRKKKSTAKLSHARGEGNGWYIIRLRKFVNYIYIITKHGLTSFHIHTKRSPNGTCCSREPQQYRDCYFRIHTQQNIDCTLFKTSAPSYLPTGIAM